MKSRMTAAVKQGLLSAGQYRRTLQHATFPGVAVLCYHGVRADDLPDGAIALQYLHIKASTLEAHCRVIRDCCHPIALDDWRGALAGQGPLPPRPVLITFDDGYRSVLRLGAPILAAYGLPAAVFVCTGPIATRRMLWFDAVAAREGEAAVEAWKSRPYDEWLASVGTPPLVPDDDPRALVTSDELAALSRMPGIEIGGHTVAHPILARASRDRQHDEIGRNLESIRQWTGHPVRAFAYPNGRPGLDYTDATMDILSREGIDTAFTTRPAFSLAAEQALERSRFFMLDNVSAAELAHRLTYSWPR